MAFDLKAAILGIQKTDTLDSRVVADKVFDLIPVEEYPAVIQLLLPSYVTQVRSQERNRPTVTEAETTGDHWVDDEGDPNLMPPAPREVRARVSSSRNGRAVQWRAEIVAWLNAGMDVAGVAKRRSEMTFADLITAANQRRGLAEANLASAAELEAQAALLQEHNAATLADLPRDVLAKLAGVK